MNSLSKKKLLKNGWTINLITQENQNVPPGSKTPDWYDPDYKNKKTTPEEQRELERIKTELSKTMKK